MESTRQHDFAPWRHGGKLALTSGSIITGFMSIIATIHFEDDMRLYDHRVYE